MTRALSMGRSKAAFRIMAWTLTILMPIVTGCSAPEEQGSDLKSSVESTSLEVASPSAARTYDLRRFAANSPFDTKYESPVPEKAKRLWARSFLWEKAPELVVGKWLTDKPETKGKHLLIEFWATWCRQCRLAAPRLNELHRKFGGELVIIGISDESEQVVRSLKEPTMDFHIAIDTQGRMKEKMGVFGIPHVIIVEPEGHVVWEGFPLLEGHELTEQVVEKILKVG
ncbi:MAG: TlpA family protein disulfide reductase, partial [Planctomycetota bacterium]